MSLLNTLILPTDKPELARTMLEKLIHEQPHIVMVALGTSPDIESLVEMADKVVGSQRMFLALAWARMPDQIAPVIQTLGADPPALAQQIAGARAFTLSRSDVIKDVIRADEPAPDMTRVWESFAKGGQGPTP